MRDTEPRPTHRENSPDALLGTLLEVDALRRRGITTRYSTREQDIRDGIEDAVTAILERMFDPGIWWCTLFA